MTKRRVIITAVAMSGLLGCATGYHPMGFMGGFESNWLSPNVLSVTVMGNGFTNPGRVREMALLQSAERARESGYCYFVFVKSDDRSSVAYIPQGTTTETTGTVTGNSFNATSTTSGGGYTPIFRPGEALTVAMFTSPPPGYRPGQFFDVAQIINGELGARYLDEASRAIPVTCTANSAGR
jgi:hypothetical protein